MALALLVARKAANGMLACNSESAGVVISSLSIIIRNMPHLKHRPS